MEELWVARCAARKKRASLHMLGGGLPPTALHQATHISSSDRRSELQFTSNVGKDKRVAQNAGGGHAHAPILEFK